MKLSAISIRRSIFRALIALSPVVTLFSILLLLAMKGVPALGFLLVAPMPVFYFLLVIAAVAAVFLTITFGSFLWNKFFSKQINDRTGVEKVATAVPKPGITSPVNVAVTAAVGPSSTLTNSSRRSDSDSEEATSPEEAFDATRHRNAAALDVADRASAGLTSPPMLPSPETPNPSPDLAAMRAKLKECLNASTKAATALRDGAITHHPIATLTHAATVAESPPGGDALPTRSSLLVDGASGRISAAAAAAAAASVAAVSGLGLMGGIRPPLPEAESITLVGGARMAAPAAVPPTTPPNTKRVPTTPTGTGGSAGADSAAVSSASGVDLSPAMSSASTGLPALPTKPVLKVRGNKAMLLGHPTSTTITASTPGSATKVRVKGRAHLVAPTDAANPSDGASVASSIHGGGGAAAGGAGGSRYTMARGVRGYR